VMDRNTFRVKVLQYCAACIEHVIEFAPEADFKEALNFLKSMPDEESSSVMYKKFQRMDRKYNSYTVPTQIYLAIVAALWLAKHRGDFSLNCQMQPCAEAVYIAMDRKYGRDLWCGRVTPERSITQEYDWQDAKCAELFDSVAVAAK
jgi:hypothetical protein